MWAFLREELPRGRGLRFAASLDGAPASFADAVRGWRDNADFRGLFNAALAESPFVAFRWETPGVTASSAARPFEFVLLDAPGLARRPDRWAFAEHFRDAERVVTFPNLGGDAVLVVPCPVAGDSAYGHLAAFVREAPEHQRDDLWRAVGEAVEGRLGVKPVWVSTAGAGVAWLHVRLDDRPKYYAHARYAEST